MSVTVITGDVVRTTRRSDNVRTTRPPDDGQTARPTVDVRLNRWAAHDDAVAAARAKLKVLLALAFAVDGWPRRITLPAPHTPAEAEALDAFVIALRADLPGVVVLIR